MDDRALVRVGMVLDMASILASIFSSTLATSRNNLWQAATRARDLGVHRSRLAGDFVGRDDDGGLMCAPAVVRLPALLKARRPFPTPSAS